MADENKDVKPTRREKTLWNVMVRHSPFVLKSADVEAYDADEARRLFLDLAKKAHEDRCTRTDKNPSLDQKTKEDTKTAIRAAYDRGVAAIGAIVNAVEFVIRPASEVRAAREKLIEAQSKALAGV